MRACMSGQEIQERIMQEVLRAIVSGEKGAGTTNARRPAIMFYK